MDEKKKSDTHEVKNQPLEMIVLDEEDPKESKQSTSKCINYLCTSGVNLISTPLFCLSYYRVRNETKKYQKICKECYDKAVEHNDTLCHKFMNNENILDVDFSIRHETVTIDDSDSDTEYEVENKTYISDEAVKTISENIDEITEELIKKFNYDLKINEAAEYLQKKYDENSGSYLEVKTMLETIRRDVDTMLIETYDSLRPDNILLDPLEIVYDKDESKRIIEGGVEFGYREPPTDLPKQGTLNRPSLRLGQYYYIKHTATLCSWSRFKLENIVSDNNKILSFVVVRETAKKVIQRMSITTKELAYSQPPNALLDHGTRVIALFEHDIIQHNKRDSYYAGVVGECPCSYNNYRYLIFFDDGYSNYVDYKHVFLVYESSHNVWEDVHPDSSEFIRKYLAQYPNRPMVRLMKGGHERTEFRGKWYTATVRKVDCSLVQMHFDALKRSEWIYRGSRRFRILYNEELAATKRRSQFHPRAGITRGVSFTPNETIVVPSEDGDNKIQQKSFARKSTKPPIESNENKPKIVKQDSRPPGKIIYYTPRKQHPKLQIPVKHRCSESCQSHMLTSLSRLKGYGPLAKPLLCGYYRLMYKMRQKQPFIVYKTPCGRSIRNMEELHHYLRTTKCQLSVDLFSFDTRVRCLAEFILEPNNPIMKDLSCGVEEVAIPVVNYENNIIMESITYTNERKPTEGVNLNLDPEFLVCCDCDNDCTDKSKCACWQLTLEGMKYFKKKNGGYVYRRLKDPIISGIYECNSRCKCSKTCLNRVVQFPLQHKLQVFRTANRGWGIRCINDIPEGSFLCIYAGFLLTDHKANEGGMISGDEFLAELDYIEVVEKEKEHYEKNAYESGEESVVEDDEVDENYEDEKYEPHDSDFNNDTDFVPSTRISNSDSNIRTRLRKREKEGADISSKKIRGNNDEDDDDDVVMIGDDDAREPSSFNPMEDDFSSINSIRRKFGINEKPYIMDAKYTGNIGRFLNHSCSPNVFVQNVFVDTHDLRFPWVAFFAKSWIRAGTELTWNYNYEIGSVPTKTIICLCGSTECKGRLL